MPVPKAEVLELMRMDVDPDEVGEIRELWKEHSKAEDNRSIEGAARDPDRGLCLHGLSRRRLLARARGRSALLHGAPDGVPDILIRATRTS